MVLVKHLPRESALQRQIHGEAAEWSVTDHLLAAVVDHLAVSNWMFTCVNSGEDSDPPEFPQAVPRPGSKEDEHGDEDGEGTVTGTVGGAPAPPAGTPAHAVSPGELARFFG
ncbi:hypothetical protein ACFWG5_05635 [Streptomyces hydrogenans]|uniref:hypothetical protein n=1 Tax=Streptomyces TaxID=1883 RepID=UPI0025482083